MLNLINMMWLDTRTNLRTFVNFKTQFLIVNMINMIWLDTSTNFRTFLI